MQIRSCITPILILCTAVMLPAQPPMMNKEARERIEAQRIAFITDQLHLTPDEAARFWPIYNEYKDGLKDLRDEFERPDLESITDDEASKLLDKQLQQEQKKLELRRTLVTRLRTVVSPKKVLMLQRAEMEFNRELLRKVQERRNP